MSKFEAFFTFSNTNRINVGLDLENTKRKHFYWRVIYLRKYRTQRNVLTVNTEPTHVDD